MIERGQVIVGRYQTAEDTGVNPNTVKRKLELFENLSMVCRFPTNKFTIISICNYDKWNEQNIARDQQKTNKRPTRDQQETTYKNEKNEKNEKKKNIYVEQARLLFSFWKETFQKPRAVYSADRRLKITTRLREGYSVEDGKRAILNCSRSSYHMEHGYNDIGLIFRNAEKLERFRDLDKQTEVDAALAELKRGDEERRARGR
jgi:hypothetical protein